MTVDTAKADVCRRCAEMAQLWHDIVCWNHLARMLHDDPRIR